MKTILIIVIAIVLVGLFLASATASEDTFELTDEQAKRVERDLEETRKDLIEMQDRDVDLDNVQ